ncbi:MAG TPA: GNAT family N-acetyltransferase [Anaerolineaceae bacterium]|jgi:ribosomal protein S18 acetylase RimI-like enzyme|nr:GNAT family N-acetyltransferase [Anaerolineaceae bacterium]
MQIVEIKQVDDEIVAAFNRLIPQLTTTNPPPTLAELQDMLAAGNSHLLIARDDAGRIVGGLTVVVFRIPTGLRTRIEDVVVESSARGQGIGEALSRAGLELAQRLGADSVDLTSHPSRIEANRLYQRLGFTIRHTNVYRYIFPKHGATS